MRRPSRTTALLLLVFLASTLFLRAGLGQFSDDYAYDRRDPVTGVNSLPLGGLLPPYVFRPLYMIIVPALETRFGGVPAVLHVINAAAHALVAWLLYRLLRRIGAAPQA